MTVAFHHRPGSFSDRWIAYCEREKINYKIINAFDTDIIDQLQDCDAFMWHHHHNQYKDVLTAKRILYALEHAGIKVFPDFHTAWHFDDKVAQKYLLEAIGAPLVPSFVFYEKIEALQWAKETTYPKVFKLKGGAGATNVRLVSDFYEAKKVVDKAFSKGFSQFNRWNNLKEKWRRYKKKQDPITSVFKGLGRLIIPTQYSKEQSRERGYVYFQEFIPNNTFDIRVIIVGNKAFALKRMVRENDFRASGSGHIVYDKKEIDERCIQISFQVNEKLKSQSVAFDYVFNEKNEPLIVEISYGYAVGAYDPCPGYWTSDLNWHQEKFNPQEWMVKQLLDSF